MGSVVSTAADGLGTFVGNSLSAPFKALFGASCEGVCSGTWDLPCFVEHLCVSSLARLFVVAILTYIVLLFGYLLCKLGIVKCVAKNAFKMVWKPCSACCRALGGACCLLCHKVRDTKRVYRGRRRRRRDVELGELSTSSCDDTDSYSSSSSSSEDDDGDRRGGGTAAGRSRGKPSSSSVREKRKERIRQSLRLKRVNSKVEHAARVNQGSGRHHRHSTVPRGTEVSSMSSMRVHGSVARGHSHAHRRHMKDEPRQLAGATIRRDIPSMTYGYSTG
ncbi:hypothetical protein SETIT_2G123600v2 [Setaria italica]|uniref:Uncharacterized protein n=1 Tax=Setaria italica TaxID=4555 RepID=K3ZZN0_SETIT|nr:hypothetical protein SETIT_2G123600v2 [Setaria italica]